MAASLNRSSGSSLASTPVVAVAAAVVSSMMEAPYHPQHTHHHYQPDLQPVSFNGPTLEQNNIPAHCTHNYNHSHSHHYLGINHHHHHQNNNYQYPYSSNSQNANYNAPITGSNYSNQSAAAAAAAVAADYYSTNHEYQANSYATQINNHDNNQSSSLNTPTLDQTVSSYYPAFQQQAAAAVANDPPAIYPASSDYYFPGHQQHQQHLQQQQQQQHDQHSTVLAAAAATTAGSLYDQLGSSQCDEPSGASLFAGSSPYLTHNSYLSSQQHLTTIGCPVVLSGGQQQQQHGSSTAATQQASPMDRAKGTPQHPAQSMPPIQPIGSTSASRQTRRGGPAAAASQREMASSPQGGRQTVGHLHLQPQQQHNRTLPLQLKPNNNNRATTSGSDSINSTANSQANSRLPHATANSLAPFLPAAASADLKVSHQHQNTQAQSLGSRMILGGNKNAGKQIQQRNNSSSSSTTTTTTSSTSAAHRVARPATSGDGSTETANSFAPTIPLASIEGGQMISRRKNATRETTATLKDWLDEHDQNPYPTKGEKIMLSIITKMSLTQVSTWFANARRRMKKENKLFWGATGKQGNQPAGSLNGNNSNGGCGGAGNCGPNSQANRGTASIRYFIHKHQKQLAGASSMLALAGHRIQGRPFVYCPHVQSSSYTKQPAAAATAAPIERQPKAPPKVTQAAAQSSAAFSSASTSVSASFSASSAAAAATTTTGPTRSSSPSPSPSPSPSSSSRSQSSSSSSSSPRLGLELGSPSSTTTKPATWGECNHRQPPKSL